MNYHYEGLVRDSKVLYIKGHNQKDYGFSFNMTNSLGGWRVDIIPLNNIDIPSIHLLVHFATEEDPRDMVLKTTRLGNETREQTFELPKVRNETEPVKNETHYETIGYYNTNIGTGTEEDYRYAAVQILREN